MTPVRSISSVHAYCRLDALLVAAATVLACQAESGRPRQTATDAAGSGQVQVDARPMGTGGSGGSGAGGTGGGSVADAAGDNRPPTVVVDGGANPDRPAADMNRLPDASAQEVGPTGKLLLASPVPADAGTPRCTMPGITNIATFESVFLQETGVATAQKKRNCSTSMCHGGNYGPDLRGTNVGVKIATTHKGTYHCADTDMKVIDVDRPDRSMLLWRLFLTPKTAICSDKDDDSMMRRMPLIVGLQDSGGDPASVAARLSAAELECARWYVHEVARVVKAMRP